MVATLPAIKGSDLINALKLELDPSCLLPADDEHPIPRVAVGSLDINQVRIAEALQVYSCPGCSVLCFVCLGYRMCWCRFPDCVFECKANTRPWS